MKITFFRFQKEIEISKYRILGWQLGLFNWNNWLNLEFHLNISHHCDHSGFNFYIQILGLFFEFESYDTRHWNNEKNTWEIYDVDKSMYEIYDEKD